MAWIEVHQELLHHPKNLALAAALHVPEYASAGILVGVWTWALQYADDGVIAADREAVVARYIGWRKSGAELFDAMRRCGWSDGESLHDWMDYAGRLVRRRALNAERMRAARASDVQRTSTARAIATVPDLTVPIPPTPAVAGAAGNGSPRARGTNPRAQGTNPRSFDPPPAPTLYYRGVCPDCHMEINQRGTSGPFIGHAEGCTRTAAHAAEGGKA